MSIYNSFCIRFGCLKTFHIIRIPLCISVITVDISGFAISQKDDIYRFVRLCRLFCISNFFCILQSFFPVCSFCYAVISNGFPESASTAVGRSPSTLCVFKSRTFSVNGISVPLETIRLILICTAGSKADQLYFYNIIQ